MFFDCSALVMGLLAAVIAKWKPTKKFSYGFGRVEVLSGFVNCLFLTVIGIMLVKEAILRLVAPVEVHTHHLLSVSVIGLFVNIIGLVSFSFRAQNLKFIQITKLHLFSYNLRVGRFNNIMNNPVFCLFRHRK